MSTGNDRHRLRFGGFLTTVSAFLMVGLVVVGASRAAFFDTTGNPGNTFAAGDVILTDDDSDTAMFEVTNMAPGDSVIHCIEVTYEGSLTPADINLYVGAGDLGGTGLAQYLDLEVELGTGGSFADCAGFSGSTVFDGDLAGFAADHTNFGSGTGDWVANATDESRTYRFTITLQDENDAQGLTASVGFTWEAQNQ